MNTAIIDHKFITSQKKASFLTKNKKLILSLAIASVASLLSSPQKTHATALGTGGTYTESGGYGIHTFTSSGTFTPSEDLGVEVLIVGGGGGGIGGTWGGGGGGGGGILHKQYHSVSSQAYTVTVGAGGAEGLSGSNSSFDTTIIGYGGGGATTSQTISTREGGSGGGGGHSNPGAIGGTSIQDSNSGGTGYGNAGGNHVYSVPYYCGSGGGADTAGATNGAGGAGMAFSITGSSVYYGGGGGQSSSTNGATTGGVGGGGAGNYTGNGVAGTANTGGGGGGSKSGTGGSGGSGIVIIRYLLIPPTQATGGIYTESGGYGIHTFTISGTFTPGDSMDVEYLVLGGGGGGSGGVTAVNYGGGGGGGTIRTSTGYALTAQPYTITVGAGGGGTLQSNAGSGDSSIFDTITATGGVGHANASRTGGANADYAGGTDSSGTDAGGGAGSGANGSGMTGGIGTTSSISGSSVDYGGGGGGNQNGTASDGGGAGTITVGADGTDGKGGGGGGGSASLGGGGGGSGIVIIKYLLPPPPTTPTISTATVISDTSIQWNFTDNADDETGFRVYDDSDTLKATCASTNLSSCTETGLTGSTSYTRKVVAYNDGGNSGYSATDTASTLAPSCDPSLGDSSHTITADCSFTGYTDATNGSNIISGLDSGSGETNTSVLTISSGILTINSNESVVIGSIELTGGSIAKAEGSKIMPGYSLWGIDGDGDGYPETTTFYAQISSPVDGVRINTIIDVATADCDDGSYNVSNSCCVIDTYYADNDGDGYGAGAGASMCPTAGYVTNNTDCYDSNASAKPGSTACSGGHRGDGSFDYNCSGAATTCSGYDLVGASSGTAWARTGCGTVVYVNTAPTSKVGCGNNGYAYVNASVSLTSQVNCQNSISLVTKKKRIGTQQRQCQ